MELIENFIKLLNLIFRINFPLRCHPSDMAVAMVALDAVVQIRQPRGERSIPLRDFHLLTGKTPERETVLEHGELIVAVDLPVSTFGKRSHRTI